MVCFIIRLIIISFGLILPKEVFSQDDSNFHKCITEFQTSKLNLYKVESDTLAQRKGEDSIRLVFNSCIQKKTFPEFNKKSGSNKFVKLGDIKSKIILIAFHYVGCPACVNETRALNKLYKEYSSAELEIICFSLSSMEKILQNPYPPNFTTLPNAKDFCGKIGVIVYPQLFILNSKREIVDYKLGASYDNYNETYLDIKSSVENLLK